MSTAKLILSFAERPSFLNMQADNTDLVPKTKSAKTVFGLSTAGSGQTQRLKCHETHQIKRKVRKIAEPVWRF